MSLFQTIRFTARTAQLGRAPLWSAERSTQVALRRLEKLVRFAVARSPHFREKYRDVRLDRIALADLPISTKDELRANFDACVTDQAVRREDAERFLADPANIGRWFHGKYSVSHASDGQRLPMLVVQD